jgi:hypothetical protein
VGGIFTVTDSVRDYGADIPILETVRIEAGAAGQGTTRIGKLATLAKQEGSKLGWSHSASRKRGS